MNIDEILKLWWVSIPLGVFLGVLSNFIFKWTDKPLSEFALSLPLKTKAYLAQRSAKAKERYEHEEKITAKRLQFLKEHPEAVTQLRGEANQYQIKVMLSLVITINFLLLLSAGLSKATSLSSFDSDQIQFFVTTLAFVGIAALYGLTCLRNWLHLQVLLRVHLAQVNSENIGEWHNP